MNTYNDNDIILTIEDNRAYVPGMITELAIGALSMNRNAAGSVKILISEH